MKKATRNVVALDLASRKYALRIVAKAKGKGSYRRTEKHRTWKDGGASSVFGVRILPSFVAEVGQNFFEPSPAAGYCSGAITQEEANEPASCPST